MSQKSGAVATDATADVSAHPAAPVSKGRGRRPAEPGVDSREMILEAAINEFARRGFDGATTAAVARVSGVTQPLVHYYFGTKEGLWRAAVESLGQRLTMVMDAASDDAECMEAEPGLRVFIRRYIYFCAANPDLGRLIAREAVERGQRLSWMCDKFLRTFSVQFRNVLERGQDEGTVRQTPPENAFFAMLAAGSFFFDGAPLAEELFGIDPFDQDRIESFAETTTAVFLEGLRAQPH